MNSKLIMTIIGITFLMNSTMAQVRYGIRAGANFSKWQGESLQLVEDLVDKTDGYITTKGTIGFHAGGFVSIPISKTIRFEPGLGYTKKGYGIKGDLKIDELKFLGINVGAQVMQHYVDMPLVVRVNVVKGLNVYAGPQVSYLVRSTLNAKAGVLGISLFNKGFGITERFNKFDLGLTGGLGYQFNNGLNIQAGYDYGLSKLDKNNNYDIHNRVVKVSLGFGF